MTGDENAGLDFARHFALDANVTFLNHGSFGACPLPVLEAQQRLRARLEHQPVQFFVRDLERLLDDARASLARFLGAAPADIAWVGNATAGVNAVLRSLAFREGDELVTTDHEYNACRNVLDYVAAQTGARVVIASIPYPLESPDLVYENVMSSVTSHTRLVLLDHVTSQTGLVLPVERLVAALNERGVETLIDGAHAPGMLELELETLAPTYYTGNCHKWLCAPKGAGFLYVRRDRQPAIRPIAISHGANSTRTDRSRFLIEFDWIGTCDPTAMLCVPEALEFMDSLLPGGWPALRAHNRTAALAGRRLLCDALGVEPPCPDEMIGALATLPLPPGSGPPSDSPLYTDPLQDELLEKWGIEVPIIPWPASPQRLVRISAQIYNRREQYELLGKALTTALRTPNHRIG